MATRSDVGGATAWVDDDVPSGPSSGPLHATTSSVRSLAARRRRDGRGRGNGVIG
jgi:hypothetical protein